MNFAKAQDPTDPFPKVMKDGDLVIAYERHDSMDHFYLTAGKILNNKFGSFYHNDFLGQPFGSKIKSRTSVGWLYALEPTPELWSLAVHTRTQIVNELDSSVVISYLDLHPGCVVVESGTGSGCMTLAMSRVVAPTGKIKTFEYNPQRAEMARAEFDRLGVGHLVDVTCRDVCAKFDSEGGGGFAGVAPHSVDAVFLDLPEPWLAVDHAKEVLKPGKMLCTYSPCIEQVMKTCEKLRSSGFQAIKMRETRQRPFDGKVVYLESLNTGSAACLKRMGKPTTQIGSSQDAAVEGEDPSSCPGGSSTEAAADETSASSSDQSSNKRQRLEKLSSEDVSVPLDKGLAQGEDLVSEAVEHANKNASNFRRPPLVVATPPPVPTFVARPTSTMKGHTAFLTFAVSPQETPGALAASPSNS